MTIEKVYDELYGMIEDLKKQIAAASGGSDVSITPALESGEKIADFEIDGVEGALYAPDNSGFFDVVTSETKIGTYKGSDYYRAIVEIPALASTATTTTYAHGISNINKIISFDIYFTTGSGIVNDSMSIGIQGDAYQNAYTVRGYVDNTNVSVVTGTDRSAWSAVAVFTYTKSTENRTKKTGGKK